MLLLAVTAAAQICPNNIVSNGDFLNGVVYGDMPPGAVTGWVRLTDTPRVEDQGCPVPACIEMFGNLGAGDAIKQELSVPIGVEVSPARPRYQAY